MAEDSTSGSAQPPPTVTTDEQEVSSSASTSHPQPTQPFVRPPPSQTFDPAAVFMEAYDCAKLNNNWNKVSSSLMIHPEWLTRIPENRRWTMLHQIVFSGNVAHLNEVLALQLNNQDFRLLCKTRDDKTVREVANERQHIHPAMMRRIERLVSVDQLLNNAKDHRWDLVKQCIAMQPDIVNEKPPYRQHFLAHYLASVGELEVFKDIAKNCHFKLDLLADGKTIAQIARDNNQVEFAEYIESLPVSTSADTDSTSHHAASSHATGGPYYSPGFYEDPCISFIPPNFNMNSLFSMSGSHGHSYHFHHTTGDHGQFANNTLFVGGSSTSTIESGFQDDNENAHSTSSTTPKPYVSSTTDEEQAEYEKTIMSNVTLMSQDNLLKSITCCITKSILRDPVVAADGFTYEREAIENWFQHSHRSPMTNQELESLELKPNYAIKSILQILQGNNAALDKSSKN